MISLPKDQVKGINTLIYHFIWKGNDKIKRSALINDINDGGLKMLDRYSFNDLRTESNGIKKKKKNKEEENIAPGK